MKKKRLFALVMTAALAMTSLAGCGDKTGGVKLLP